MMGGYKNWNKRLTAPLKYWLGGQASLSYLCCKNHYDIQSLGWAVWTAAPCVS